LKDKVKTRITEFIENHKDDRWSLTVLIIAVLLIPAFYLTINESRQNTGRMIAFVLYAVSLGVFFYRQDSLRFSPGWIIGFGAGYRLIVLIFAMDTSIAFNPADSLSRHEWAGIVYRLSYPYVTELSPLFEILSLVLEAILIVMIYYIIRRARYSQWVLMLYIWNPFVIWELYVHWNPLLMWSVFMLIGGALIVYHKDILASIALSVSLLFHDLGILFIPLLVRRLRWLLLIPLAAFMAILLLPGYSEYHLSRIVYSQWFKEYIQFFWDAGTLNLRDYWIIGIISFFLSIGVWGLLSSRDYHEKIYYGFWVFTMAYPAFFEEVSLIIIVLGAIFRNPGLLVLSLYHFMRPVFEDYKLTMFTEYDLHWQYGIVILFFLLSHREDVKEGILRLLFSQGRR